MRTLRLLFLLLVGLPTLAVAGPRVGNGPAGHGGGAWICQGRDPRSYEWIASVDLFEAINEYGLTLETTGGQDEWEIVEQKLVEVQKRAPDLANILKLDPTKLRSLLHVVPSSNTLAFIDDVRPRVLPAPESCAGGYLFYGQLANFTDDGRVLINGLYWNQPALGVQGRAALLLHEIIYKGLRDAHGETDSSRAREIVGLLFSTLAPQTLTERITKVLARSGPSDAAPAPIDHLRFTCRASVSDDDGGFKQLSFRSPLASASDEKLTILDFSFEVVTSPDSGLPNQLTITDSHLGSVTTLEGPVLKSVLRSERAVSVELERKATTETALLSCEEL